MEKELIIVKQLPIIEERLKTISAEAKAKVCTALALECTEDTVKEIKKVRADLSRDFKELEDRRKDVKKQVMNPYDQFEAVYKKYVTEVYSPADRELKARIGDVEDAIKEEKRKEVEAYFDEYAASVGVDILTRESDDIKVTLTASMKSLKEDVRRLIDKRAEDTATIRQMENADEIMVEYWRCLDLARAIRTVTERHNELERQREARALAEEQAKQREEAAAKVEAVAAEQAPIAHEIAPKPKDDPNVILTATFTVTATREKLRALREYMIREGIEYGN